MRIVEPYAVMMSPRMTDPEFSRLDGIEMLRRVEFAARVSHRSEDAQTHDSWDRFIRSVVLQHGDWSVTEHEKVTVDMLVDRGITHEIVRHRIASYTQESTRFVNPIKKDGECKFIMPLDLVEKIKPWPVSGSSEPLKISTALHAWESMMVNAELAYMVMLESGCAPQIARSVLPNALASRIIVTMNLRGWRHFLIMRTTRQAHPQMRQVTLPLLAEFQAKIPILYEDIVPEANQAEAIQKGR